MFLRDFYLQADRDEIGLQRAREFGLVARPVVVLYGECFESRNVYDSWRFAVFATREKRYHREITCPAGVATIYWHVDFAKFFALDGTERRKATLRILHAAVMEIAKRKRISAAPFEAAHRRIRSLELRGERECRRLRGVRGLTAVVRGHYEIDQFVAELLVQNRHGFVIGRTVAFRAKSDEIYFDDKLGPLRWEGPSHVVLLSKEKRIVARLRL
jgi:hypothetical protein